MTCKGTCTRHLSQKPVNGLSRYLDGQKRCQICQIYIRWDGIWCPCCSTKLRIYPRERKYRNKIMLHARNSNLELFAANSVLGKRGLNYS